MKWLVACLCLFAALSQANDMDPLDQMGQAVVTGRLNTARGFAAELTKRLESGKADRLMAEVANTAIGNLLKQATREMERRGKVNEAYFLRRDWEMNFDGFLQRMVANPNRNIGDHKPLSEFLRKAYDAIEAALGKTVCEMLKLTSIKVFNFGIPVVFHPKDFPMDGVQGDRITEYRRHFCGKTDGEIYHGFVSDVLYWVVWGICEAATYGGGWVVICNPLASGAEWIFEQRFCGSLSDKVYAKWGQ